MGPRTPPRLIPPPLLGGPASGFHTKIIVRHDIAEIWLKVALNTNKTGQHVIRYTEHIVESVDKHQ